VFTVVPSADEGGELKISDQGTAVDEVLRGSLKKQFVGQELRLQYEIRASQSTTGLHVRLLDDSDSGMIDCGFGGDGWIRIGGKDIAPYEAGSSYAVTLDLLDPLAGPEYWVATVKKSDGTVWLSSGPLSLDKQLTVRSVEIRRPAGSSTGEFRIDDLRVLSYGLAFGL
jgi:hypothetical protein